MTVESAAHLPRLLIVDGDVGVIRLMNEVFRGLGKLFFASDGAAAIRACREKKPDLVLLDAGMPGMDGYRDGYRVCEALKADPATAAASSSSSPPMRTSIMRRRR
jgi:CheY-like chemotaxis protein